MIGEQHLDRLESLAKDRVVTFGPSHDEAPRLDTIFRCQTWIRAKKIPIHGRISVQHRVPNFPVFRIGLRPWRIGIDDETKDLHQGVSCASRSLLTRASTAS